MVLLYAEWENATHHMLAVNDISKGIGIFLFYIKHYKPVLTIQPPFTQYGKNGIGTTQNILITTINCCSVCIYMNALALEIQMIEQ